ncbi:hypothetical protein RRG08_028576 [Elysia crispata]|uniref:Uncharacterized protein n=1 Tax=Elysia crispata TaxID=231223 RepID=A0AAE0Y9L2_9GAST|nr:hypothetical protein RRG08_028576 [Elysia crispata]
MLNLKGKSEQIDTSDLVRYIAARSQWNNSLQAAFSSNLTPLSLIGSPDSRLQGQDYIHKGPFSEKEQKIDDVNEEVGGAAFC